MPSSRSRERHATLGDYLRARRAKLDPVALGFPLGRRRTPGLRREEVAQRANVSATWYTWLEQGRGGAPSPDVLDRIARALMLTDAERQYAFLLALGRTPEVEYHAPAPVAPRLQRLLDALEFVPAYLKTLTWDIVAWNRAATVVLTDYGTIPPQERNLLRLFFTDAAVRKNQSDWRRTARFMVSSFRADVARAGATREVQPMVDDLSRTSPDFAELWRDNDVEHALGEKPKVMRHPILGAIALEYSTFGVDGRPDLSMAILNPATPKDAQRIRALIERSAKLKRSNLRRGRPRSL